MQGIRPRVGSLPELVHFRNCVHVKIEGVKACASCGQRQHQSHYACAHLRRAPWLPVRPARSEPARSTKDSRRSSPPCHRGHNESHRLQIGHSVVSQKRRAVILTLVGRQPLCTSTFACMTVHMQCSCSCNRLRSHTCGASTMMVNMECERLDAWLSAVRAFCRARLPRRSTSTASSAQFTGTCGGYDWNQQMAQRLPACSCNGIFA